MAATFLLAPMVIWGSLYYSPIFLFTVGTNKVFVVVVVDALVRVEF